jgi:hypothetical protein
MAAILIRANNARQSAHGVKPYLCKSAHGVKPYQPAPGRRLEVPAAAVRRQQQYVGSSSTSAAAVRRQQQEVGSSRRSPAAGGRQQQHVGSSYDQYLSSAALLAADAAAQG